MTTERSDKIYETWRQASDKFDYFILGVNGALCAYITQTYEFDKIGVNPSTLEFVALLLFFLSVYFGFRRIEVAIVLYKVNHDILHRKEVQGALMSKLSGNLILNQSSGEVMRPEEVQARINKNKEELPKLKSLYDTQAGIANLLYKRRNRFLVAGFIALLAAKVWSAYVLV